MSFHRMKALAALDLPANAKLVAAFMSSYANAHGGSIFPSIGRLARDCSLNARTVQRAIALLREHGLVELVAAGGGRSTNRYRLKLPDRPTPTPDTEPPVSQDHRCHDAASGVSHNRPSGGSVPPESSTETTKEEDSPGDLRSPPPTPIATTPPAAEQSTDQVSRLEPVETPGPAPPPRRRKRRTPLPADFEPSIEDRHWAATAIAESSVAIDLDAETERFKSRNLAKDERYARWDHAWRNWIRNAIKFAGRDAGADRRKCRITSIDERRSRLAAAAIRGGET